MEKVGEFKGQKNEASIKKIIETHTKEDNIVLNFFSGTGTTAAIAHSDIDVYFLNLFSELT